MEPEIYDRWYQSDRGRWIGECEAGLAHRMLEPRRGESLLDVGCGTGYFTRYFATLPGSRVAGVDINEAWLRFARGKSQAQGDYLVADAMALPFRDYAFDLTVSIAALGFIVDESAALREMVRVTRRRLVVGLLNRHSLLFAGKGRKGGSGGYVGATWHTEANIRRLFGGLPVNNVRVRYAIHLPGGGWLARRFEQHCPHWLPAGSLLLASVDPMPG